MRLLGKALTFDDVLLVPAFSQVLPKDTSLATRFSRNIALNLPLVSAAMDTVTEARLAIAIAQEGGIGIVHKNLTSPKPGRRRWPRSSATNPACCATRSSSRPDTTVRQVMQLSEELGISGFPVVDGGKVVGIVTGRDLRFETRYDAAGARDHDAARAPDHRARRHHARRSQGAAEQAQARAPAGGQRRLRAQGPDHRQGHHQADQRSPTPRAMPPGQLRVGAAVGRGRGHRGARRGAGQGRRRRDRGGHRARPQQGRDRARALGQEELPAGRRDRRQHRHRRGGAGAGRGRRRRGQGRHRPGLDLHHAHRRRRGRAADHGDRQRGHGAARAAACR